MDLPYLCVTFLSENALIAAGFGFTPVAFVKKGENWTYGGHCDAKEKSKKQEQGVRSAFNKFQQSASIGEQNIAKQMDIKTKHHNAINSLQIYKGAPTKVDKFSTSGIDGKLHFWDVAEVAKLIDGFAL